MRNPLVFPQDQFSSTFLASRKGESLVLVFFVLLIFYIFVASTKEDKIIGPCYGTPMYFISAWIITKQTFYLLWVFSFFFKKKGGFLVLHDCYQVQGIEGGW